MSITIERPPNGNPGIVPPWLQNPPPPVFGIYPMPEQPTEPTPPSVEPEPSS